MRRLKYLWFYLVMLLTRLLPDWVPVMRLRGLLVRPCFRRCGKNFQIEHTAMVVNSAHVEIGNDVYLAHGCWIQGIGGIVIEDAVMLGPDTVLASSDHTMEKGGYRFGQPQRERICIGRGSWTGAHTTITKGVTIGRGVLCAAGSVVTRDVPDYTVVGGVPARIISRVDPETGEKVGPATD